MSDHPAAPVEAFEPPYYVAVFTTVRTEEQSGYRETNARMEELVQEVPGYLGMDHAQTPGGLSITVGYFRDADALTRWRTDTEHRAAQAGRVVPELHAARGQSGAEPRVHASVGSSTSDSDGGREPRRDAVRSGSRHRRRTGCCR
ncbi:antibiotic biosynthesis monooxygenase family protein [Amycolatopsis sp. RTGN1]|uniref:antibiotic biosynthesis monooxygenase family protein n=1 Tax=Amycolatopsis ponsaeliensis TaxID=2992142 RepID=UPI00330794FC